MLIILSHKSFPQSSHEYLDIKFDIKRSIKFVWTRETIYIKVATSHTKISEVGIGGEWKNKAICL